MSGIAQGEPFDIYVRCGDRYELVIDITAADGVTPVNTTGWTGVAKAVSKTGTVLITFTVAINNGTIRMTATAAQTALITGEGEYQLAVSDGNADGRVTYLWGKMHTKKAVA